MQKSALLALAAMATAAGLAAPVGAQPQAGVTAEWFAGTWSDRADCSQRVHFLRNGRFYTVEGNEGRWRLEGSEVILSTPNGSGTPRRMAVERLDQNRLRAGGVVSYRCEGRSAPTPR